MNTNMKNITVIRTGPSQVAEAMLRCMAGKEDVDWHQEALTLLAGLTAILTSEMPERLVVMMECSDAFHNAMKKQGVEFNLKNILPEDSAS